MHSLLAEQQEMHLARRRRVDMDLRERRELVRKGPDGCQHPVDDGMDEERVLHLDQVIGTLAEKTDPLPVVLHPHIELRAQPVVVGARRGEDRKQALRLHAADPFQRVQQDLLLVA